MYVALGNCCFDQWPSFCTEFRFDLHIIFSKLNAIFYNFSGSLSSFCNCRGS